MKRLLSLVLVLLLASLPAFAITINLPEIAGLGSPEGEALTLNVLEDNLLTYQGFWGLSGVYTGVIENNTGLDVSIYGNKLEGFDKDGTSLFNLDVYGTYPGYLAAGEKAVVFSNLLEITPEQAAALDKWTLTSIAYPTGEGETIHTTFLPVTAAFTQKAQDDYQGGTILEGTITATLTNNTNEAVFETNTQVLLRDQEGKLITATTINPFEVGVPAGGSIILLANISSELLADLEKAGRTITTAEALSFVQKVTYTD